MIRSLLIRLIALVVLLICTTASFAHGNAFPEKISRAVTEYLESVWGEGQVVWIPNSIRSVSYLPGDSEVEVVPCGKPRGATVLNLNVQKDGRLLRRLPVSVRVMPFAWVPVAGSSMKARQTLDVGTVRWERREVTRIPGDWLESREELIETEWWAKRAVRAGDLLTFDRIEPRPEVARGDIVALLAVKGGVTVKTDGIALQNGCNGDRIKVENLNNGIRLRGIVKGNATVLVERVEKRKTR